MARRQGFKQGDVTRALKGAVAAGLKPSRVEIDAAGRIVLDFGQGTPAAEANPFDTWKAKRDARPA
jgi:hypothetical protein